MSHQASTVRQDWRHRAECRDADPESFFGVKDSGSGQPLLAWELAAKQVCARCPVITACRAWSLGSGQEFGVSGGMAAQERRAARRRAS